MPGSAVVLCVYLLIARKPRGVRDSKAHIPTLQANWLRSVGVRKGDAVALYMPMVCELPIAMLACARIGAVHSVVFGGFSAEALAGTCRAAAGWHGG